MRFGIFAVALSAGTLVNAIQQPHVHQHLGHLGEIAYPNDKLGALAPEIRTAAALFARKAQRTKCSGRGRRVTVTNFHTVTASSSDLTTSLEVSLSTSESSLVSEVETSVTETSVLTDTATSTQAGETEASLAETSQTSASQVTKASASSIISATNGLTNATTSVLSIETEPSIAETSTVSPDQQTQASASDISATTTTSLLEGATSSSTVEETESTIAGASTASTAAVTSASASDISPAATTALLTETTSSSTIEETESTITEASASSTGAAISSGIPTVNPTEPVPVSRAGGTLDPSAAAEAHEFDNTATRAVESVNIRAPDGRCLFVDPTAGDFRQNLIPVQLVECSEAPNQKFDLVSKGKHNDGKANKVLVVSVLMNGCVSFDGRRQEGDTVTVFSCGGRAAGDGETDQAQLYPFDGSDNIILAPGSGNDETCLIEGDERLVSGSCANDDSQAFEIVEVL